MNILALESSTQRASVCLSLNNKCVEEVSMRQRSHSEFFNPAIEKLLSDAKISLDKVDYFAVGIGPGSFTGIRVAGNIAKTFCYLYQKKMITVNSLELLALQVKSKGLVLSIINAYNNLIYAGLFNVDHGLVLTVKEPQVVDINTLETWIQSPVTVLGDAYDIYNNFFSDNFKSKILRNSQYLDFPQSSVLAERAVELIKLNKTLEWNLYLPLYLRASAAEENLSRKLK